MWLQGQKVTLSTQTRHFPEVSSSSPHRCGAALTPCVHSNLSSGPNMVLHQAGYVWLFSYKVTNSTPSLNRIAPREISAIIWSTFLTSLGCGCVELWNNKVCHLTRDTSAPKKITPLQTYLAKKERDPVETDCAMFTGGRGGRNWALIQPDREDICVWHKLNGLAHVFFFFFFGQTISFRCVN